MDRLAVASCPMALVFKNKLVGNKMRSLKVGTNTESEKSCVVFIECGETAALGSFLIIIFL